VLEPQSTLFFLLMMAIFGALMWWLVVAKQLVFRIFAACLAFVPAMMFGVAAVNKYYGYYQNWSAAIADLTNQGPANAAELPAGSGGHVTFHKLLGNSIDYRLAAMQGYTLHLRVHGPISHVTRTVYVYLPPQYFQRRYRGDRFPAIELLHGFPGTPQDWITLLSVPTVLQGLVNRGRASPVVLVMPDVNGGRGISLQCLNQYRGPLDATYLALDVPDYISRVLRVRRPGRTWGIAGYSEGGFCAANLGLQYGARFGFSGVMSGYFKPSDNQLINPLRQVSPFGRNKKRARRNTPDDFVEELRPGTPVPLFWLGVGASDLADYRNALIFEQLLKIRQPGVTLRVVPGGGHTMFTWRRLLPEMLAWMTKQQAAVARYESRVHAHPSPSAGAPGSARRPHRARRPAVPSPTHTAHRHGRRHTRT
jgi:enterochelin esterase-like enzyme